MSRHWSIRTEWATLESGAPEERAGFAALGIQAGGVWLTAGHDRLLQSMREAPCLSAYHFAEWLAWNWRRLRWEPRRSSTEWDLSHAMASIGHGYVWPDVRVISDGRRIALVSRPTPERARTPYRYINDLTAVIPAFDFESEVDLFIETVLNRLAVCEVADSNLATLWTTVLRERQDAASSQLRKIEAMLGEDPGEMNDGQLHHLRENAVLTGESALEEIAANRAPHGDIPDIASLILLTRAAGAPTSRGNRIDLRLNTTADMEHGPAWKAGADAARQLRSQLQLDPAAPIDNARLAEMFGTSRQTLETAQNPSVRADLSCTLETSDTPGHVLLRSNWESGRRFELARLLGDCLLHDTSDAMRPATRSDTHRQKIQRAFAAELLSPFEAVEEMLRGDYSMESQQDIAHHFQVSELTIRTLLVNHERIDRSELAEAG